MKLEPFYCTSVAIALLVSFASGPPFVALAQNDPQITSPSQISTAAQESIDKGVSAAKQQQWLVAIRYFDGARTAAPESPIPLYNLGLAEAKIPGRELRAICWFEAYLALTPNAANAVAVRHNITDLDVRAESEARKFIELLKVAADKASFANEVLPNIASLLVRSGDLDSAEAILNRSKDTDAVRWKMAPALAEIGRSTEALKQVDQIHSDLLKMDAYKEVISVQIEAGVLSDAKASLDAASGVRDKPDTDGKYYSSALQLATAEYDVGQHEQASKLLQDTKMFLDQGNFRSDVEIRIKFAVAQYKLGQPAVGDAVLGQIRNSLGNLESSNPEQLWNWTRILDALAEAAGKIGERQRALRLLDEAEQTCRAMMRAGGYGISPIPMGDVYVGMQDWDGAEALARRVTASDDFGMKSRAAKAQWLAWKEEDIAKAKEAIAYADAKASSMKTLADPNSSLARRAQVWSNLVNSTMNTPLFTDFSTALNDLASGAPTASNPDTDPSLSFDHIEKQIEVLVNTRKTIHDLQTKTMSLPFHG